MNRWVVCVEDGGYAASLEARKLYEVLPDSEAEKMDMVRVVDESGEDYLYPREQFGEIRITEEVAAALRRACA
jgi:hypothetical protein